MRCVQRAPRRWGQAARRCVMHRVVGALLGTTGRVSRGLSNAVRVCAVAMRSLTRNIGVWEVHARACSVLRRCVRALHCWLYCQRQHVRIKQSPHVTNETSDGVPKRCDDSLFLDGDNECERCDENTCAARFDAATCLSCGSGRYLSGESRMLNDVLDQVCDLPMTNGKGCALGKSGFYRVGTECVACTQHCTTCTNTGCSV